MFREYLPREIRALAPPHPPDTEGKNDKACSPDEM
jgi:hypothetical protein